MNSPTRKTHQVMNEVLLACLPAALMSVWFYGPGIVLNLILAPLSALACEAVVSTMRGRPPMSTWADRSTLVAAILLALSIPPIVPLWLPVIGAAIAVVVGKQLYGGLGQNPFNPAMVGYAALLVSFPLETSLWPTQWSETGLTVTDLFTDYNTLPWDAISSATVLDANNTTLRAGGELRPNDLIAQPASWIAFAWLLGGAWLLKRSIISWHIPASLLLAVAFMASVFYLVDATRYASPLTHVFSGACVMGAFFIATDPVSAPAHRRARIVFGLGIGVLIYVIRSWGSFPDGVAFAVLLMNLAAPALDHLYRGRS